MALAGMSVWLAGWWGVRVKGLGLCADICAGMGRGGVLCAGPTRTEGSNGSIVLI